MIDFDRIPFDPHPDQQQVHERAARHFGLGNRKGKVISAPGTGKTKMGTLISLSVLDILMREREEMGGERRNRYVFGYKIPTLGLGDQLANDLRRDLLPALPSDLPVKFTFVCSDEDMGAGEDRNITLKATNDPAALRDSVFDAQDGALHIVISTYASTPVEVAACQGRDPESCYDFLLLDEAHWSAGVREPAKKGRARKKREVNYQDAADDRKIPRRYQLALTATEKTVQLRRRQQGDVFSMDDVSVYGQNIGGLRVAQAIELGRVRNYRFVPTAVRLSDVRALVETEGSPYHGLTIEEAAHAYALECLVDDADYEVAQALAFHKGFARDDDQDATGGIAASKRLCKTLNARASLRTGRRVRAMHLDGQSDVIERREFFDALQNPPDPAEEILVGSTADAFSEGINIPHANLIIFDKNRGVQPTNQAIGRVVRTTVDSRMATAALAVIVDDTNPHEPKIDPASLERWLKVQSDIKKIDSRINDRVELLHEVNDEHLGVLPHPPERQFQNRYEAIMLEELARSIQQLMEEARADINLQVKRIAAKEYECVLWDEKNEKWRVMIPSIDGGLALDEYHDDPETAAGRYDEWVIENGKNWPLNGILADPRRQSQIVFDKDIHSGIHERERPAKDGARRSEWVFQAYYRMSPERQRAAAKVEQRESGRFRITRKARDLRDAIRVADALDARFEPGSTRRMPGEPIDFSIIRNRKNQDEEVPAVEECPIRGWWATATDLSGKTVSLGHYRSRDEAVWAASEGQRLLDAEDPKLHNPERVLATGERIERQLRSEMPARFRVLPRAPSH